LYLLQHHPAKCSHGPLVSAHVAQGAAELRTEGPAPQEGRKGPAHQHSKGRTQGVACVPVPPGGGDCFPPRPNAHYHVGWEVPSLALAPAPAADFALLFHPPLQPCYCLCFAGSTPSSFRHRTVSGLSLA
jgi:hypothetical protein